MIYLDPLMNNGWHLRGRQVPNSHMIADTLEELHEFARKIGMKREWFQKKSTPHYDLTPSRRAVAVYMGAKELSRREFVEVLKRLRGL